MLLCFVRTKQIVCLSWFVGLFLKLYLNRITENIVNDNKQFISCWVVISLCTIAKCASFIHLSDMDFSLLAMSSSPKLLGRLFWSALVGFTLSEFLLVLLLLAQVSQLFECISAA